MELVVEEMVQIIIQQLKQVQLILVVVEVEQ